ncbi:hypothetical protein RCO48_36995 [Peribacillus frigoritolerans]|nr:hypothetical protein [Peribacillus frigoritolerans]
MKNSINLAGAYIGIIIGAGFASGQEVLQFFTSFGIYSVLGIVVATVLFAFLGMQLPSWEALSRHVPIKASSIIFAAAL